MINKCLRVFPDARAVGCSLALVTTLGLSACSATAPDTDVVSPGSYSVTTALPDSSPGDDVRDAVSNSRGQLVVFPFTLSLQRHYLVRDPVLERVGHAPIDAAITDSVQKWANHEGYELLKLDPDKRQNRFAAQRLSATSIRLLNRKGSLSKVPALPQLVASIKQSVEYPDGDDADTLLMAGTYTGHVKSGGQLVKERVTSAMRYAGNLGRSPYYRPANGFGKLFVVLLEPASGKIVWYGDSESAPSSVGESLDALLLGQ